MYTLCMHQITTVAVQNRWCQHTYLFGKYQRDTFKAINNIIGCDVHFTPLSSPVHHEERYRRMLVGEINPRLAYCICSIVDTEITR